MLTYVDDIVLATVDALLHDLGMAFAFKDLSELSLFLGVEVKKISDGILLSQENYTNELLAHVNTSKCSTIDTSLFTSEKLSLINREALSSEDYTGYKSIVGALQYIILTRSDIYYLINKVCQFFACANHSALDSS
jgi:hypothetical protein